MADNNTGMRILYRERRQGGDFHAYDEFPDVVSVVLRKWHDEETKTTEYTLHKLVLVDAEKMVDHRQVVNSLKESDLIRMAIKDFDALLEGHPSKGAMS